MSSSRLKGFSLECLLVDSSRKKIPKITTHFLLLSLVVTHCIIRCHSLYHALSFVVTGCTTRCHSLSLNVSLVCLFINDRERNNQFLLVCYFQQQEKCRKSYKVIVCSTCQLTSSFDENKKLFQKLRNMAILKVQISKYKLLCKTCYESYLGYDCCEFATNLFRIIPFLVTVVIICPRS